MSGRFHDPRHVLITGASSGIGAALAEAYAAPGRRLALTGRDENRLASIAETCRAAGAEVATACLDVTEAQPLADWIAAQDATRPLALVVANAGVSAGTGSQGAESAAQARAIYRVNVEGVMNTIEPALACLRPRQDGQLAIMSSLAAFRGFPGAPAYCASKAMVRIWGEALRAHLAAEGIGVTVICPGFVASRMTAVNDFPMPLLVPADKAAATIKRGLARNRARIAFPWPLYSAAWLLGVLPPGLTDRLLARLPAKG
jgi:NADP-dependent 3-hydroxy acid dehydrogenase YdfG